LGEEHEVMYFIVVAWFGFHALFCGFCQGAFKWR